MKRLMSAAIVLALVGCGGAGGGIAPSHPSSLTQPATKIRVAIPKRTSTSSATRKPAFVSPNTNGLAISVFAHSDATRAHVLATTAVDLSSTSSSCTTQPDGSRICTFSIAAPPSAAGDSTDFIFANYDLAPVSGAIPGGAVKLGTATATTTIVAGTNSTVNATLGGVVSSVNVLPFNAHPTGSRATSQVLVVALDASGATIIGSDPYSSPLTLASSDPTLTLTSTPSGGTTTAPAASVALNAPTDIIRYAYSGDVNSGATTGPLSLTLTGAGAAVVATLTATPSGTITDYGGSLLGPTGIAAGPDGNLWFTEPNGGKLGMITTGGAITEYYGTSSGPFAITAGPDGNLWFTESNIGKVGKITTGGAVTEYGGSLSTPFGITAGPDGNLWFTEFGNGKVGKITTDGTITEYTGFLGETYAITTGPDSNLWFTDSALGLIGKITTGGAVTEYSGSLSNPAGITNGPDGNLWFTDFVSGKIGKITTSGAITEYGGSLSNPEGITAGPDGNLWFTEVSNGKVGKITTDGTITEYGGSLSNPSGITTGSDGNLWFTEYGNGKIGRIVP